MPNNLSIKDASAATQSLKTTETTGVHTPHHIVDGTVAVTGPLTDTQLRAADVPISAASLPLPTGAATSANQTTANTSLSNIDTDLGALADSAATTDTGSFSLISLFKRLLSTKLPNSSGGRVPVDGSGVTQPVSGTVTAAQTTAANLNATVVGSGSFTAAQATAANLNATVVQGTATNLKTQAENYQGGSAVGSGNPLQVTLANTGANATAVKVDGSGVTQPVSGTVGISGTVPVSGTFWQATQPVSGTVTAAQTTAANLNATVVGSGSFTAAQATAANLNATVVQGTATSLKTQAENYQGGSAVGSGNPLQVTLANTGSNSTAILTTNRGATGEATVSNFTSTTSATLKSSNSNRKVLTIYNEGAGNLHVLYGSGTASTTNYSVKLFSGDYLEIDKYTGQVNAIFATAGTARVTEIT